MEWNPAIPPDDTERYPIRVLQIIGSLDYGGTELRLLDIAKSFPSSILECHFLLLSGREGSLAEEARAAGAAIHTVRIGPGLPIAYWRVLQRVKPHVVHSHVQFSSGMFLAIAALGRTPRRIAHFRSASDVRPGQVQNRRRKLQRSLGRRLIAWCATDVLAVSRSVLNAQWPYQRRGRVRCEVLVHGIKPLPLPSTFASENRLPHKVVQIGRFSEIKNQRLSVEVLRALKSRGIACCLNLVGDRCTQYGASVVDLVAESGLSDAVEMPGVIKNAGRTVLADAKVLMNPSVVEGLPGVVLEAASLGLTVIASDIPPHRELASIFQSIKLVSLDGRVSDWVDQLQVVLESSVDPDQRRVLVDRFLASEYTYERYIERIANLYGVPDAPIILQPSAD